MRKLIILSAVFVLFLCSGCGGGGDTVTSPQSITSQSGSLEFSAKWPGSGDDMSAQVIQPEVEKIEITITGSNIPTPIVIYLNKGETTKVISNIPAGTVQLEFKGLNSAGVVLSSRITQVTVLSGQTVNVSVILGISILADGFYPSKITIYIGDALVFVNNDTVPHTISIPGKTDTVTIQPGGSYSCLFGTGSLPSYTCTGDGGTTLTIIIGNAVIATPTTGPVATKEIFVDPNGSDTTGDGSFTRPYMTVDKGITVANGDQTVATVTLIAPVDPTTYDPNTTLSIRNGVTLRKYVSDPNMAGNKCVIDFTGVSITSSAGIILAGANTLQNLTVQNVTNVQSATAGNQSGIRVEGAGCIIENCTVQQVAEGSGIRVAGAGCNIKNCTIKDNYYTLPLPFVHNGAGIAVQGTGCTIRDCTITGNSLLGDGVKITPAATPPSTKQDNSKLTDNKERQKHRRLKEIIASSVPEMPSGGFGGGISVDTGASCYMYGANSITENYAPAGGGIANRGTLSVSGTISENGALYAGGGIANIGRLTVTDTNFTKNLVYCPSGYPSYNTFAGGAIANIGECTITGNYNNSVGIIEGNYVTTDDINDYLVGGGISNTVYEVSGTIRKGTCTVKGIKIGKNYLYGQTEEVPKSYGGGIYNASTMTVTENLIYQNWTSGYGGAICNDFQYTDPNTVVSRGNCTINSSTIGTWNCSAYGGGGIQNYATLTINSSTIKTNLAGDGDGGGISECSVDYDTYQVEATCTLNNSIIGGDTSADMNQCTGSGGGIYLGDPHSILNINGTISINNNASVKDGGGIANYGVVNISATGTIHLNQCGTTTAGKGGGICNFAGSSCSLSGSGTINENKCIISGGHGGGIYNETGATYSNTGWTFNGNTPDQVYP